jgi:phenylacetate-CoA ligase
MTLGRFAALFSPGVSRDWLRTWSRFDVTAYERLLTTVPESAWQRAGERRALRLFHLASQRVPAYRDFLRKHRIDPKRIVTMSDFARVPQTDKHNYVSAYPLHARCWDGKVADTQLVAMSSGTSGKPVVWPRAGLQEFEASVTHDLLYRTLFDVHRYKTLLLIGFPMGVYVSGMATAIPSWLVAQKGYPLTIATVGNDRQAMIETLRILASQVEQVIIVGHPFFTKDVLEAGRDAGWRWFTRRVRMLFCSEGFSEAWRDYVVKLAGQQKGACAAFNTYGSAEMLLMAYETPATIALRRRLERSRRLRLEVLNDDVTPHIFQYNPLLRFLEEVDGELVFTAASGIPLIRFNLRDRGRLLRNALGPKDEESEESSRRQKRWQLPCVAMWGRGNHALVFHAVNIYPEHIRQTLDHPDFLGRLTGHFSMRATHTREMDERWELNVELREGEQAADELARALRAHVWITLPKLNLEFRDVAARLQRRAKPRVKLWPYRHPKYFAAGTKPRYIGVP